MGKLMHTSAVIFVAGLAMLSVGGCGKKSVHSGGEAQSSQAGATKNPSGDTGVMGGSGGMSDAPRGVGSNFPDTSLQSGSSSGGLRGLDKNPSEERLGPGGVMVAKADPSAGGTRQLEDLRSEHAASASAGLRDVFFGYDSWNITEEGRQALLRDAEWIKANPNTSLKVEGHCDERGTEAYNLVLGEKRAKSVRNYLVELGVSANRLSVVSYGKERPFCMEHAESCYQQNRRGHLVVKSGK
ncbi:MAG TPA: peptidoglycan-associated lipoprotein Pal [Nitrospiraceae bacterium]